MTFTNGITLAVQLLAMMIGGTAAIVFLFGLYCALTDDDRPRQQGSKQ